MSKGKDNRGLETVSSQEEYTFEHAENQYSHASSDENETSSSDDVDLEKFAKTNGLGHKLDVLRKASVLLQNDRFPDDLTEHETTTLRNATSHKWRQPKLLYFTIAICSLGAVEQGWAQTAMNGANLYFPKMLGVGSDSTRDTTIVGLINSGLYLSVGVWGAWLSEPVNNKLGRRGAIFVANIICLLGSVGSALSGHWAVLLLFRLVLGTGLGINASTVSVYAAECAPPAIRGGLSVSWQMFTAFGIFLGFMANAGFYDHGPNTWRFQLAGPFIPTVPLLAMVYLCPESPAWYMKTERYGLAYQSLTRLRNAEIQAAQEVYAGYVQKQKKGAMPVLTGLSYFTRIIELFTIPRIRHATFASYTVMLSQQLCGINIIAFYSSTIFSNAGFSTYYALLASCIFGLVNFLGAFPAIWTMDSLGRRSLLLWTLPGMALTLLLTGLTFKLPRNNVQFGLLATLIYLFCAEYSPGMGPVPCAYSAEVFPLSHREVGMSLAIATANFWAAVLSLTFPALLSKMGSEFSFELYALLNVVAFVLVLFFVRETKQKTLDELDEVFTPNLGDFATVLIKEDIPATWDKYILRKNNAEEGGNTRARNARYRALGQDEEE